MLAWASALSFQSFLFKACARGTVYVCYSVEPAQEVRLRVRRCTCPFRSCWRWNGTWQRVLFVLSFLWLNAAPSPLHIRLHFFSSFSSSIHQDCHQQPSPDHQNLQSRGIRLPSFQPSFIYCQITYHFYSYFYSCPPVHITALVGDHSTRNDNV